MLFILLSATTLLRQNKITQTFFIVTKVNYAASKNIDLSSNLNQF